MAGNVKVHLGNHFIMFEGERLELFLFQSYYIFSPERIRIDAEDSNGHPFCTLSLNDPAQADKLKKDEFIVKDYNENEDIWEQMLDFWRFADTGRYDEHFRPIWRLLGPDVECSDGEEDGGGERR